MTSCALFCPPFLKGFHFGFGFGFCVCISASYGVGGILLLFFSDGYILSPTYLPYVPTAILHKP